MPEGWFRAEQRRAEAAGSRVVDDRRAAMPTAEGVDPLERVTYDHGTAGAHHDGRMGRHDDDMASVTETARKAVVVAEPERELGDAAGSMTVDEDIMGRRWSGQGRNKKRENGEGDGATAHRTMNAATAADVPCGWKRMPILGSVAGTSVRTAGSSIVASSVTATGINTGWSVACERR